MLILAALMLIGAGIFFRDTKSDDVEYFKNEKGNCSMIDYNYFIN